jgi:hypothetical protein
MVAREVTTMAQPAVMEEVVAVQPQATALAAVPAAKAIPVPQAVIIGQATEAVALPVQVLGCKVAPEQPAQSQVLVYLEQVVVVVVEIVQNIAAMVIQVAAEATAVLQIGATPIIHTAKILVEDGE